MKDNFIPNEEFYSLPIYADSRVLTPRNETEIMVNEILKLDLGQSVYIDIGTGSGCIPIAVLKNTKQLPTLSYALDISLDALEVAKINTQFHKLDNILQLKYSNLLASFGDKNIPNIFKNKEIIISANLPYIKNGDVDNMDKEVLENDPYNALFGGPETGFELYEELLGQIIDFKNVYNTSQITAFFEIGFDQYDYSREYLKKLGVKTKYFKDYMGIWRIVQIEI